MTPLKVEVISTQTIKPSSPTPAHLRNFKLSLLDQCADSGHVPIILYYTANVNGKVHNEDRLDHLKKSLSEILTLFYPLAGRIRDNVLIDCNDEGVNFSETRVSCCLNQVYSNPVPEELDQLLPGTENFYESGRKVLLSIQVNIFVCGGMALGSCMSHKIADASSFNLFLQNWAYLARGDDKVLRPKFDFTSLFPPKLDLPTITASCSEEQAKKVICKRFIFNASSVASLKAKCCCSVNVKPPTRVEAVFSLIWRCALNAVTMRAKCAKSSTAVISMNMRRRMVPPLSDINFGNAVLMIVASTPIENTTTELHSLVSPLRDAKRKIDEDFMKNLQVDLGFLMHLCSVGEVYNLSTKGEVEFYVFSTWLGTSFYETDFGWGKPAWVSSGNLIWKNLILLMDTKCGKGVEAWVSLKEEDMARFECDSELLSFTSTK